MKQISFQLISDKQMRKYLVKGDLYELKPPLFLLIKQGSIPVQNGQEQCIETSSISVSAKQEMMHITSLSKDSDCKLLQYECKTKKTRTM